MAVVGTGITITGANGFFAEVLNIEDAQMQRARISISHMGSANMDYVPGKLPDWGQLDVELAFDPDIKPPLDNDPETWTITYPTGASWARAGFMENFRYTGPLEERMTGMGTLKFSGDLTVTPATP